MGADFCVSEFMIENGLEKTNFRPAIPGLPHQHLILLRLTSPYVLLLRTFLS